MKLDLYERYAALVPAIARSVKMRVPASIDTEDLEQIGRLALAQACERFDPERAAAFPSYIKMRVRGAMIDAIRGREFREASRERDAVRLDAKPPIGMRERPVAAAAADPYLEKTLARELQLLPARQASLIDLRYRQELSQSQAAARLGISKSQVAREESAALKAMRARMLPKAA